MPKTFLSRPTLIAAALLLSTSALGVTLAAARDHGDRHGTVGAAADDGDSHLRLASEPGVRRRADEGHHGRHSDDDDDDDEDGRGVVGQPRPSGPDVPAPDNGLFSDKAKPKVDVQ